MNMYANKKFHLAIKKKLEMYAVEDTRKFGVSDNQLAFDDALALVKRSNGVCPDCNSELILHSWRPKDLRQFSFDRLDDSKNHSFSNCRVTCFGCNRKKADDEFKPDYRYLKVYDALVAEYRIGSRAVYGGHVRSDEFKSRLQGVINSAHRYHELTYGDRKKNNWRYDSRFEDAEVDYNAYYSWRNYY